MSDRKEELEEGRMPLLDHFHPPLSEMRKWEGFHSQWTSSLAAQLNAGPLPVPLTAVTP